MKSGFRSFLRAVIAAALLAVGWLGTCPAAAGTPPMGAHPSAYDGHHSSEVRTYTTTERGPPTSPALHTAYDADDHRSRGTLARPDGATSPAATQYTPAVTVAQGAASTTTTGRHARLADRTFCALYRGSVAANAGRHGADEFVDLASAARRNHILYGDATGGGHLWPGLPGKTPFPKEWSADRVMHEISDVATDPSSIFRPGRGGSTIATGTRDGVDIRVILRDGDIITGYPTNLPRNP